MITTANTTNAFPAGPLRPNLVGDPTLPSDQQARSHWFNTALTLEKSIALTDAVKFDLRVEAYNLLNRANFNLPGFTLGAADFGTISSARPARTVQWGARVSF